MKLNNIKIGTQLRLSFAAMLLFVIILGAVSYWQSTKIHKQTQDIYNHPFQVRGMLGKIEADILKMRLGSRNLLLAKTREEHQDAKETIELASADIVEQFNGLNSHYLGPRSNIEDAYKAFTRWRLAREASEKLAQEDNIASVLENTSSTSIEGKLRTNMLEKIAVIDDFALIKGDKLFANSNELVYNLNLQLLTLVASIVLLSFIINYYLRRTISIQIDELIAATQRFHAGDLTARSINDSKNEFGALSASFNTMVEGIEENAILTQKTTSLSSLMVSKYKPREFFQATISDLAMHTNSQMAAVYLLSEDKKSFVHFESIGLDETARQSFNANNFEGEFGAALASRKVVHIKNIADNTSFTFDAANGKYRAHEIITIPIITNNEVAAIISLATIGSYNKISRALIDSVLVVLGARIEGVMAYQTMRKLLETLETQNRELEAQKSEMASQSIELMQQNSTLEIQKNQLKEASKLKTSFLSNMSHELRTPLNSVIALSGVLNRRLANKIEAEEYSYLAVIERNGKHLLELINDILDIARIETGREEVGKSNFRLDALIGDIIEMISPLAQQKGIQLIMQSTNSNIIISSDADKCRHIIQNIIANAVKFTDKGSVEVAIGQTSFEAIITITDTGIGIAETNLEHIFDEFRQADGSTSRRFGGTGLGLAIAKKYAALIGGTISVTSEIDKGSTFTLTLPLNSKEKDSNTERNTPLGTSQAIKEPQATKSTSNKTVIKTVLLVDDSEPAIIQTKDFLEEFGYKTMIARDGGEALAMINKTIPDAIILDLMMPVVDGFEVLKTIRKAVQTAHIPVLILTAKTITKEELTFLTNNNIHQLIQKGDVNRTELLHALISMVTIEVEKPHEDGIKAEIRQAHPTLAIKRQEILGKPTVLVVEDNIDNLITAKALLANDYTVLEATNGQEGIDVAIKSKPDLILLDIAMPIMDGIEAFKAIRQNSKLEHIPIIALTASAMTTDREVILAHGFDAYISKPIDQAIFIKTINQTLYGK